MIFLDFDGTIVDIWKRYYTVFKELTGATISEEEYKYMKLAVKSDSKISELVNCNIPNDYFEKKRELLESAKYLRLDSLLLTKSAMEKIARKESLIVTKRRNIDSFDKQLKALGISIPHAVVASGISKMEWIKHNCTFTLGYIIGDTIEDLEVANLPGITAIMVRSGLGTEEDFLSNNKRCSIVDSIMNINFDDLN